MAPEPILIVLGSNIEPRKYLPLAIERLAERLDLRAVSRVYESEAVSSGSGVSNADSARFLNAAVRVVTDLSPAQLKFDVLRPIESELGRVRDENPDAPRTIDLDLALYGDRVIEDPETGIKLPDPEIVRRAYIALPLADVAPETLHPTAGETLGAIAGSLRGFGDVRTLDELQLQLPGREERSSDPMA